jgi:acyl-CoA synthetase (NDP forming)
VASDSVVARSLARDAGVILADTLEDFEDLVRLFAMLRGRSVAGLALGAVSNAGYETVAIADNLGPFSLARYSEGTSNTLRDVIEEAGLGAIVTVRNPLDLTPILDDAKYEAVVRAVLEDPGVSAAVVGCVPMTGALQTLAAGQGHAEDLTRPNGIVARLTRVAHECGKAWIAVVDAGPLYDPMAHALEAEGIPTFRTADRAIRLFGRYCEARVEQRLHRLHEIRSAEPALDAG